VDTLSARSLAVQVFGEDSSDLEADMLGELANMSMGALKASFNREAISFTGGLPEAIHRDELPQFSANCAYLETFTLAVADAHIVVRIGILSKKNESVKASSLCEGMVLAKNVFNANGMLLLSAGTRLSSTAIQRLRQSLDKTQSVEVAWSAR
jgi:hypothetical protein